jgi:hypothetical protein
MLLNFNYAFVGVFFISARYGAFDYPALFTRISQDVGAPLRNRSNTFDGFLFSKLRKICVCVLLILDNFTDDVLAATMANFVASTTESLKKSSIAGPVGASAASSVQSSPQSDSALSEPQRPQPHARALVVPSTGSVQELAVMRASRTADSDDLGSFQRPSPLRV